MPLTPGKRGGGARGVKREAPTSDDTPGNSPSRKQVHKRKKTTDKTIAKSAEKPVEKNDAPEEPVNTELPEQQEDIDMDNSEIVEAVAATLGVPPHEVQVCKDHDNRHAENVQHNAYAKIAGNNWTFYVKRTTIFIGRPPEAYYPERQEGDAQPTPAMSNEGTGLPAEPTESTRVHIDLGPNKVVSRLHAELFFNGEDHSAISPGWYLQVNGRNGAKVDERMVRRGQTAKLNSGSVVEISGLEFMFVLPGEATIAKTYLRRAGLIRNEFPDDGDQTKYDEIKGRPTRGASGTFERQPGLPGHQVLRPAPPDYRKPDTPQGRQKSRGIPSSTPRGSGLTFIDPDIDLSAKEAENIKPSFTYSQLISQAILSTRDHKATLSAIYDYVKAKYAYYRCGDRAEKGWQNSIRHNLSLNAGFYLQARETHEPGKGGYWVFQEDKKQDLVAEAWGKARRSPNKKSSSPSMPDTKPRRPPPGPGDANGGSPVRKPKRSPRQSQSPTRNAFLPNVPQFTPDQRRYSSSARDELPGDGSPLPRKSRHGNTNMYGFSDNIQGSPPVLSSSYAAEEGNSLITPAPQRKRPILAPPSTLQRPSQHMPTSSPAPFWRFADLTANTPLRAYDASPSKMGNNLLQSSSPPRPDLANSPSRNNGDLKPELGLDQDEEPAFDLSKRFTSISKFHANNGMAIANGNA